MGGECAGAASCCARDGGVESAWACASEYIESERDPRGVFNPVWGYVRGGERAGGFVQDGGNRASAVG